MTAETQQSAPRGYRGYCPHKGCSFHIDSPKSEWAVRGVRDHYRRSHPAKQKQTDPYAWRGKLNASQRRVLELAATGAIPAHYTICTVLAENRSFGRWYPSHFDSQLQRWVTGLVEAGFLVAGPAFGRSGLVRLTAAGRRLLASEASSA